MKKKYVRFEISNGNWAFVEYTSDEELENLVAKTVGTSLDLMGKGTITTHATITTSATGEFQPTPLDRVYDASTWLLGMACTKSLAGQL